MRPKVDISIERSGLIFLVHPNTPWASTWLEKNVQREGMWMQGTLICEYPRARVLLEQIKEAGFSVA